MRYYLLSAVAAAVLATPAMARDGSLYVGVEAGPMWVRDIHGNYQGATGSEDGSIRINNKMGIDADVIAGYDFGWLRAEAEASYKRTKISSTDPDIPNFGPFFDDGGRGRTVALMGNVLGDFGNDNGWSFYAGGGVGVARTSYKIDEISFGATDSNLAWQIIAGARTAITPNLDLGIKYRYFHTKFDLEETPVEEVMGKWNSHSLMASLIYNFASAAPPPPPPPPPPAPERG